ncbi:class I SAM-dependent methyltransferase [Reyranella sp.]|jgi:SAM-dependent methyltransferase|uniref:class I SAM-dependent methyltransferase n=1 Tax=Reyranella sp. TaxID=1929291 RepID=UPI002F92A105
MSPTTQTVENFLDLLRCPASGQRLALAGDKLATPDGSYRYPILDSAIPAFAERPGSLQAQQQLAHYDRIAAAYQANLEYPHTIEYMAYLDECLLRAVGEGSFGVAAELCCGHGEAIALFGSRIVRGIGLDISPQMLKRARAGHVDARLCFVQGDATALPLASASFDTVFMLGGIHHVPDRRRLFGEVARILKPGGRFIFREPVSDFWPWRLLRSIVYRLSPTLDHENERPLRLGETEPPLASAGLRLDRWTTHGFFGFCVFMNSDVLVVNRLFRFIPGIRGITRTAARLDEAILSAPGFSGRGLQAIGCATRLE